VFFSYLSSLIVALLLGFFYLSYVASGVFDRISKEIGKEAEIKEKPSCSFSTDSTFVFNCVADIPEPTDSQAVFLRLAVDVCDIGDGIPLRQIYLSDYFLRPPPSTL
jgi:hypothetical protein